MKADHKNILHRLKIARGQVDGLIKMVEDDRYCIDISTQLLAVIAALKSINKDVLAAHLHHCVLSSLNANNEKDSEDKINEIAAIIEKLSK
ncbi:MAG: metal-sensing transcriptional repressor [Christensenellaceae bacterium]|nr:metal-sensing transcriptional repressor [Christensenellaceae bacterium]